MRLVFQFNNSNTQNRFIDLYLTDRTLAQFSNKKNWVIISSLIYSNIFFNMRYLTRKVLMVIYGKENMNDWPYVKCQIIGIQREEFRSREVLRYIKVRVPFAPTRLFRPTCFVAVHRNKYGFKLSFTVLIPRDTAEIDTFLLFLPRSVSEITWTFGIYLFSSNLSSHHRLICDKG